MANNSTPMSESEQELERELAELQNAFEDEVTAREQAESRAAAAYDLLRECRAMLDGLEAQPLIYRIDAAMGEKK
jgi:hypothetical protein